jgi:hypothetical protein
MKKEQQKEIAQGCEARGDRLPVGGGCKGNACKKAAHLLAQPDGIAHGREHRRQRNGEDHQKFRRMGEALGQGIGKIAHEDDDGGNERQPGHEHPENGTTVPPALARAADADRGERDHRQNDDEILHDQEAQGDLTMQ